MVVFTGIQLGRYVVYHNHHMNTNHVMEISKLYQVYGNASYGPSGAIGEHVTQMAHALQAAELAEQEGWSEAEIAGCLLHDIGHLVGHLDLRNLKMGEYGYLDHENLGALWLQKRGFPSETVDLVRYHVAPKRYKAATIYNYVEQELSNASRETLKFQGGPMTPFEALHFEALPNFEKIMKLRAFDDAAKVTNKSTKAWSDYESLLFRVLQF